MEMSVRNRLRRLRRIGLLAAALLLGSQVPGAAVDGGPYPGLPKHTEVPGSWLGIIQAGMTESTTMRQWVRIPTQVVAAYTANPALQLPPGDPRDRALDSTNWIYLVAPAGSEYNYGLSAPFTVRTVAFGAIPVTATVQIVQRHGDAGLPQPIVASARNDWYPPGAPPPDWPEWTHSPLLSPNATTDTRIEDELALRVLGLVVDGTPLKLNGRCQTAKPGALSLFGKGYINGDPAVTEPLWDSGYYTPAKGGLLTGTVDIPAFAGCTTAGGEDVSRLLTAAVSGSGNPVRMRISEAFNGCVNGAPPPGAYDPEVVCPNISPPPEIDYPVR